MVIYMKKFFVAFILVTIALFFIVSCNYIPTNTLPANTLATENNRPNIIIDCGHGGEDGGAVSPKGLLEKDVNLYIGLSLRNFLIQSGFSVTMIRSDDKSLADENKITLREKKVSDLHNRAKIVNSDKNNILISVHQNMFEDSRYFGAQVFYSDNNAYSKMLAENIRSAFKGLLQKDNERQCKASSDSIYILKNSEVPSVLVECGFLSNPEEENKLHTQEYRDQLAFCIYAGFLEYYYQNYY